MYRKPYTSEESIAKKIQNLLKYRNISFANLAKAIDVTEDELKNFIFNTKDIDFHQNDELLCKIAKVLDVPVEHFFAYEYSINSDADNYITSLVERSDRNDIMTPRESAILAAYYNDDYGELSKLIVAALNDIASASFTTHSTPNITEDTVTFPVIGELAAGYDHFMNTEWDTGDIIEVPRSHLKGRPKTDFFCLRICGSSMYPLYMNGDRVLIKKTPTLSRSGEIGVVQYGDCATLKKVEYVTGEDWIKLIPINPSYEPETISGSKLEECHIIGVPVLLIRDLQPVVPDEKTI